jgi:hypothetical protein
MFEVLYFGYLINKPPTLFSTGARGVHLVLVGSSRPPGVIYLHHPIVP